MKPVQSRVEILALLLCAVVAVVLAGRRLRIAYPIALVIGGLGISLVPGLPAVQVDPDLIFLLFMPPLLYAAAWFTSWHEFKANLRPILLLAVGLVLATTLVVGVVMHALIPALPLAIAFALGAIVSPPDAVAASAIAAHMCLPRRVVAVLEGESLVNDATGLVALRFALAAAATGTFSIGAASLQFVWVAAGGLLFGLAVGLVVDWTMRFVKDDLLQIIVSLIAPFFAYLPADRFHVSGVLATVAAGIYGGWRGPELIAASTRLNAVAVWNMLVFLLNCGLFILIGLELPLVLAGLGQYSRWQLLGYGAAVSGVVILVRPIWVFPATWLPRKLSRKLRERDPMPPWQPVAVMSWCGMRGAVSLAAALALDPKLDDGSDFPMRSLVIYLLFCVILATLVLQGLTLPALIHLLKVREPPDESRERDARLKIAHAALAHLDKLAEEKHPNEAALQRVTSIYRDRVNHLTDALAEQLGWSADRERLLATRRMLLEALGAERRELIRLRREHKVDEELMHRLEREMDLEETRLKG